MFLRIEIIERIRGNKALKNDLMSKGGYTRWTLNRYLNENAEDGPLTKMSMLEIISIRLSVAISDLLTLEKNVA